MSAEILIVDDEDDIRKLMGGILEDEGYSCISASNSTQAFEKMRTHVPDLVILDIWLQGSELDGLEILERLKTEHPLLPVVMISGHGTIETAVNAIKEGAYDFIEKPFKSDRLILMIRRALENAMLRRENEALRHSADISTDLIGGSSIMQSLRQVLERVAATNSRVILTGEPGTGKDIAARFIHAHSNRSNKPFKVLNCATMKPDHLELELFGTDEMLSGEGDRSGALEKAHGGTLLLDEVADMPLETQGKILRVLQNQTFQKIGGKDDIHVDIRVIASTNKNLEEEIANGNFRQDLYYRLNVVPIHLPSLRERAEDIPELSAFFQKLISRKSGSQFAEFSEAALAHMQSYTWPGNVRQLRNVVEWVMIMHGDNGAQPYVTDQLPPDIFSNDHNRTGGAQSSSQTHSVQNAEYIALPLREARELFEREYLRSQIHRFGGNISKTAKFVGMERSALHRKMKSLDITTQNAKDEDDTNLSSQKSNEERRRA